MLQLRPNCERCDKDLPPESLEALICSFECTFCADCAQNSLHGICPNCGGELVRRPRRPAEKLKTSPASTKRVLAKKAGPELAVGSLSTGIAPTHGRKRKPIKPIKSSD